MMVLTRWWPAGSGAAGPVALLSLLLVAGSGAGCDPSEPATELLCNGSAELCHLRFDQLALAATHNSMANAEEGWIAPDQQFGLARQLDDGVRGLLLDTKEWNGALYLCHSDCELGSIPLSEALGLLRDFLAANPGEVLVILFQDAISAEQTASAFADAALDEFLYTHPAGGQWPLVGDMVAANTRLLVAAEFSGPPPAWYHHAWDLFQDTHYAFEDIESMHCQPHRGSEDSPLFLMNHWVVGPLGLSLESDAEQANQAEVLWDQVERCRQERGIQPNLVAVDFYGVGDLFEVVAELYALAE